MAQKLLWSSSWPETHNSSGLDLQVLGGTGLCVSAWPHITSTHLNHLASVRQPHCWTPWFLCLLPFPFCLVIFTFWSVPEFTHVYFFCPSSPFSPDLCMFTFWSVLEFACVYFCRSSSPVQSGSSYSLPMCLKQVEYHNLERRHASNC